MLPALGTTKNVKVMIITTFEEDNDHIKNQLLTGSNGFVIRKYLIDHKCTNWYCTSLWKSTVPMGVIQDYGGPAFLDDELKEPIEKLKKEILAIKPSIIVAFGRNITKIFKEFQNNHFESLIGNIFPVTYEDMKLHLVVAPSFTKDEIDDTRKNDFIECLDIAFNPTKIPALPGEAYDKGKTTDMFISFNDKAYEVKYWSIQDGCIGEWVVIDTETEYIQHESIIPKFVIGQAYTGGETVYLIRKQELSDFMSVHESQNFIFHNAPFDVSVIENTIDFSFHNAYLEQRIWDTGVLYRLYKLATIGYVPKRWNLKAVTKEFTGIDLEQQKTLREKVVDVIKDYIALPHYSEVPDDEIDMYTYELSSIRNKSVGYAKEISKLFEGVELDKNSDIRLNFGEYLNKDGSVDYDSIPAEAVSYASIDVIATMEVFNVLYHRARRLNKDFLSHHIQVKGDLGLYNITKNGMGVDREKHAVIDHDLQSKIGNYLTILEEKGYNIGERGNQTVLQDVLQDEALLQNFELPKTKSGKVATDQKTLEGLKDKSPFVAALMGYKKAKKLMDYVNFLKEDRVHSRFDLLKNTGRTSSFKPNVQNIPRGAGLRECFIPKPGHVFFVIDYSQLELCTLAQVCKTRYGSSVMADVINDGVDLHKWFASKVLNKDVKDVQKSERQMAKACNFGFPGGLGVKSFLTYAADTYGIQGLTEDDAKRYRNMWVSFFSEMEKYLSDPSANDIKRMYDFNKTTNKCKKKNSMSVDQSFEMFADIVSGRKSSRDKTATKSAENWVFKEVVPAIYPEFDPVNNKEDHPGFDLYRKIANKASYVQTLSGRIRTLCGFCEGKNTPFQGLASDGAKLAMYDLYAKGYRLVNFIHDEFVIEIPKMEDYKDVAIDIRDTVVSGMKKVVPDVLIKTEWFIGDRWYKDPPKDWHLEYGIPEDML